MKMLGKIGMLTGVLAAAGFFAATIACISAGLSNVTTTLMTASLITVAVSVQMFALGLIGEVCTRIYYTANDKKSYQVRDFVNFGEDGTVNEKPLFPRIAA